MLGFWPSMAGLLVAQAALVCGPRPQPPVWVSRRLRGGVWSWAMPVSLGGTIAVLAVAPGLAQVYAWIAVIGLPLLAVPSIVALLGRRDAESLVTAPGLWLAGLACAAGLLAFPWADHSGLPPQAAAVALTALSATTLAAYLAAVTPVAWLKIGVLTMATLDAILVSAQLLQGPNNTLEAATPGAHLPHLQVAVFGTAVIGYGDVFIAGVLGNILVDDLRLSGAVTPWQGALVVLGCAAAFALLFLVVDVLPATVPVAVAMLLIEIQARARAGRSRDRASSFLNQREIQAREP